jgi:hypothetical protein
MFKLLSLPDDLLFIILRKLNRSSALNISESCKIIHDYPIVKNKLYVYKCINTIYSGISTLFERTLKHWWSVFSSTTEHSE